MVWAIDKELIRATHLIEKSKREQFIAWAMEVNFFRLQNAFTLCSEAPWNCEPWYQYFSGLTVTFLTQPIQSGQGAWEDFLTWAESAEGRDRYEDITSFLEELRSDPGTLPHVERFGLSWWRQNEIPESRRDQYTSAEINNDLYLARYWLSRVGEYFFTGTEQQRQSAMIP
jgi:hypothetical protein